MFMELKGGLVREREAIGGDGVITFYQDYVTVPFGTILTTMGKMLQKKLGVYDEINS